MRVVTLNTLFGGEDRIDAIVNLLREASPDILVLQECLGWEDGTRLARVAAAISAPHAHLGQARPRGSGNRYNVAILSRRPMRIIRVHNDPAQLGHCVVDAEINGLTVFGTHFDSHTEDLRVREARYVNSIADLTKPCLLVGDLNALSRRDPYPSNFAELLEQAKVDKYGRPPRFDTIEMLESVGWIDARPESAWITARRDRGGVPIDYRTDYVFCSQAMAHRLVNARVIPANGASDHDALLAEFGD